MGTRARVLFLFLVLLLPTHLTACRSSAPSADREPLRWSGWIEETAVQRGHIAPGDFAQFGCPPGWRAAGDTAAALRGKPISAAYLGPDTPPTEGTLTCVAQREFALPSPGGPTAPTDPAPRRSLSPVSISLDPDRTTIIFSRDVSPAAAVYLGQDTPCGPRVIGVRLGDLLKWLNDPKSATTRDFLGMISAGCPEPEKP